MAASRLPLRSQATIVSQMAIPCARTAAVRAVVGVRISMGFAYFAGLAVAFVLALRHLAWIRLRERQQCFRAFLDNHWLGFAVFAGIALDFGVRLHRWPNAW